MTYRYIYKITCTEGYFKDHFYFGQHTTKNLEDGYKGGGRKINDYYKKYPNDYIKEIIAFYNTEDELNKAEYDIIHPWLNHPMCLNLREGGNVGEMSEETKNKLAESNKKTWASKELRDKISKINKGRHSSEEVKKKISEKLKGRIPWNKGKTLSTETKQKMSESMTGEKNPFYNKTHTEETKKKISESNKGKTHIVSEETKKKISESNKGRRHTEESKKKISEATKSHIPWNKGLKHKNIQQ